MRNFSEDEVANFLMRLIEFARYDQIAICRCVIVMFGWLGLIDSVEPFFMQLRIKEREVNYEKSESTPG